MSADAVTVDILDSFIETEANKSALPFEIDWETLEYGGVKEEVGGFPLCKYGEPNGAEDWFMSVLQAQQNNELAARNVMLSLANALKTEFDLTTIKEGLDAIERPLEVLGEENKDAYYVFQLEHLNEYNELVGLTRSIDKHTQRLLSCSFFLRTRYCKDWTYGKTAMLRRSQLEAIEKFIVREFNGGVEVVESPKPYAEAEEGKGSIAEI